MCTLRLKSYNVRIFKRVAASETWPGRLQQLKLARVPRLHRSCQLPMEVDDGISIRLYVCKTIDLTLSGCGRVEGHKRRNSGNKACNQPPVSHRHIEDRDRRREMLLKEMHFDFI